MGTAGRDQGEASARPGRDQRETSATFSELSAIIATPADQRDQQVLQMGIGDLVRGDRILCYRLLLELNRYAEVSEELVADIRTLGELARWVDHFRESNGRPEVDPTAEWPLVTGSLRLRSPSESDFPSVAAALSDPTRSRQMPSRGMTVSAHTVQEILFGAMTALAVVIETRNEDPELELLATFDSLSANNRRVNTNLFSLVIDRKHRRRRPLGMEAAAMAISHAFDVLPVDKICGDIPEWNYHQFHSGEGSYFNLEGVRERHEWLGAVPCRLYEIGIFRDQWKAAIQEIIGPCSMIRA